MLDTISYFVDEEGEAFFAPDDQLPRRQYTHKTLGAVKASRPMPRYASQQSMASGGYMNPYVCDAVPLVVYRAAKLSRRARTRCRATPCR
jgi:hypothetical protein